MEEMLYKLKFIRNTLKEEYPRLSDKEINSVLNFVYDERILYGERIDSIDTLESARYLCELTEGKKKSKTGNKRITVIREDDNYALIFIDAFRSLTEQEQVLILQRSNDISNINIDEEYTNVVNILVERIKESDEHIGEVVKNALLPNKEDKLERRK